MRDVTAGEHHHLNEALTGHIGDVHSSANILNINGNECVGGLVNKYVVEILMKFRSLTTL